VADLNDPVEQEYQKLLEADDTSQEAVDRLIRENEAFAARALGLSGPAVRQRLRDISRPFRRPTRIFSSAIPTRPRPAGLRQFPERPQG